MGDCQDVALFLGGEYVDSWQQQAIENMIVETDANISLLVIDDNPQLKTDESFGYYVDTISDYWPWIPVWAVHTLTEQLFGEPDHFESIHINNVEGLTDTERVYIEPNEVNHYAVTFPDDIVEMVDERADIAFLFGFGILKGDILDVPEHGILCFHHGDMSEYRGRPAGFWELLDGVDQVGITLQRISEELDKGEIVVYNEISINWDDTWQDVQAKLYGDCTHDMLVEAIQKFNDPEFTPESLETVGDHYTLPQTPLTVFRYVVKNTRRRLNGR